MGPIYCIAPLGPSNSSGRHTVSALIYDTRQSFDFLFFAFQNISKVVEKIEMYGKSRGRRVKREARKPKREPKAWKTKRPEQRDWGEGEESG